MAEKAWKALFNSFIQREIALPAPLQSFNALLLGLSSRLFPNALLCLGDDWALNKLLALGARLIALSH